MSCGRLTTRTFLLGMDAAFREAGAVDSRRIHDKFGMWRVKRLKSTADMVRRILQLPPVLVLVMAGAGD